MDCLFCSRRDIKLCGEWHRRIRWCWGCGAYYPMGFRPVWPFFPSATHARWEPVRRPWPREYYGYVAYLRYIFQRLRNGARVGGEIVDEVRAALPMCDLVRFFRSDIQGNYLETLSEPMATMLRDLIDGASNNAIELPPMTDVAEYHAICDFASWGLTRIADGQMDQKMAGDFGYDMHNFPRGGGYGHEELVQAYRRAVAGELPSPGRVEIRSRLHSMS
jgi:hypothetical protein